jgi:hypothetical protein
MADEKKGLTPARMLQLQRKLNSIFVCKRDAGLSTASIYSQLKQVEKWLSERKICW